MKTFVDTISPWNYLFLTLGISASALSGQEVFRDFNFTPVGNHFSELDPNARWEFEDGDSFYNKPLQVAKYLDIDLKNAIRTEMIFEYWGGHIGTSDQRVQINETVWFDLPQPEGTPGDPECYYRTLLGNNAIEIPIEAFNDGENVFRFSAGSQICYDFGWGMYWIYGFTVRVYYSSDLDHPSGTISTPSGSGPLRIEADIQPAENKIARVDFIGEYYDFDWDGDGIWKEWQYQSRNGTLHKHIGTRTRKPWAVKWDTKWIPEQDGPTRIRAIITDESGLSYQTEPITVELPKERNRVVKAYRPYDVPEKFGVRNDRLRSCKFLLPDDLSQVKSARLIVSSWSAATDSKDSVSKLLMNKTCIAEDFGVHHDYSFDTLKLPISTLIPGENILYMYSNYLGHALEINWPGPLLLLEMKR